MVSIGVGVSITLPYGRIGVTGGMRAPDPVMVPLEELQWGDMTLLSWGTFTLDWPGI